MAAANAFQLDRRGGRRALDAHVELLPMIDLLMVTVSFLLITAVWSHMGRLDAEGKFSASRSADVPCAAAAAGCPKPRVLHVDARGRDEVLLDWREGSAPGQPHAVPRGAASTLSEAILEAWRSGGLHRDAGDRAFDRAVVHVDNGARYAEIVALLDAIGGARRPVTVGRNGRTTMVPAFRVSLAED